MHMMNHEQRRRLRAERKDAVRLLTAALRARQPAPGFPPGGCSWAAHGPSPAGPHPTPGPPLHARPPLAGR